MNAGLSIVLSDAEIEQATKIVIENINEEAAEHALCRLRRAQPFQRDAAASLVRIVDEGRLDKDLALEILEEIERHHSTDDALMARLALALEEASDIDFLNRPPPNSELYERLVDGLEQASDRSESTEQLALILRGLANAARLMARQRDGVADKAYRRLIECEPGRASAHYGYGLFLKTRGRFTEGVEANRAARALASEPDEAHAWNLGICATGAGDGETALQIWQDIANNMKIGRFGLPEASFASCKVRLAERPLAERDRFHDDPGLEETIWIERLSPAHGIVRSVLCQDLGVDYGDVILFDGAPITYHTYGERQIPVFPHLATLLHRNYQFFDFAGVQSSQDELALRDELLSGDTAIYPHREKTKWMCRECWLDTERDHQEHRPLEHHIVKGRIAARPDIDAPSLLSELDAAFENIETASIYVPELCRAAGENRRSEIERRRYDLLTGN